MVLPQPVSRLIIFQHLQGKTPQEIQRNINRVLNAAYSLRQIRDKIYRYNSFLQRSEQTNYDRRKNYTKLTYTVRLLVRYFNKKTNGFMTGRTISNKLFRILQLRVSSNSINQYRHSLGKFVFEENIYEILVAVIDKIRFQI
jgi:hypothetical protein